MKKKIKKVKEWKDMDGGEKLAFILGMGFLIIVIIGFILMFVTIFGIIKWIG